MYINYKEFSQLEHKLMKAIAPKSLNISKAIILFRLMKLTIKFIP